MDNLFEQSLILLQCGPYPGRHPQGKKCLHGHDLNEVQQVARFLHIKRGLSLLQNWPESK